MKMKMEMEIAKLQLRIIQMKRELKYVSSVPFVTLILQHEHVEILHKVKENIKKHYNVNFELLCSKMRNQEIVMLKIAVTKIMLEAGVTQSNIARLLLLDHSTINFYIKQHINNKYSPFWAFYETIKIKDYEKNSMQRMRHVRMHRKFFRALHR